MIDAASRNETLAKRAGEIAWYANIDNTQSGNDACLHWEGQQQNIYFSDSGVTVQTHIEGSTHSRPVGAYAGWAQRTSDSRVFYCYKDNGRQLFTWTAPVPDGTNRGIFCQSIYWCIKVIGA
ncbi:hypothetical protein FS837_008284 [Tulasnella sp. UAMH 9824]|nr:hypothetical protein FS837_008284 [Tulasnella sp. UAMH 9824]